LLPLSNDGASVTMLMAVDSENQDFYELKDYFSRLSDKKA
jgi:hypothetical protein